MSNDEIRKQLEKQLEILFQNIRAELKSRKWSVDRYCKKLGIRRNTFYNWEMKNNLPASYLIRTAELFGMSVDELLRS